MSNRYSRWLDCYKYLRGGSWSIDSSRCLSISSLVSGVDGRHNFGGFRVIVESTPKALPKEKK